VSYSAILLQAERAARLPERPGAAGKYRQPRVAVVERRVPVLSSGQVLLEVCHVSICGTDVHVLQTDAEGFSRSSVPASHWETGIQFGHEVSARVAAVAADVHTVSVGDFVTADSLVPCRQADCRTCQAGHWNACPRAYLLGLQSDGVFGELAVAPASSVHPIAPIIQRYGASRGLRFATLAEPLGVALHAYQQAMRWLSTSPPRVLILGAGAIGLLLAWKARLSGTERVIVIEPNPQRAGVAGQFADEVLTPNEWQSQRECALEFQPDVIFDACGQADLETALKRLAPGGAFVTLARTGQSITFPGDGLITSGQAIIGTRGHVGHVREAIDLLASGKIDPYLLLTRSLDGIPQLFSALQNPQCLSAELKVTCQISTLCRARRRQ
jgi:scyllo-inosose 3-dehydrogenase